ncbi:MAG: hypothetical protein LUD17_11260 [Bacteroidales bacterium]|nr:hypothetical protein [Bacteroidales bacterium]
MDRIELNRILNELVEAVRPRLNLRALYAVSVVMHSDVVKQLEKGLVLNPRVELLYDQLIGEINGKAN